MSGPGFATRTARDSRHTLAPTSRTAELLLPIPTRPNRALQLTASPGRVVAGSLGGNTIGAQHRPEAGPQLSAVSVGVRRDEPEGIPKLSDNNENQVRLNAICVGIGVALGAGLGTALGAAFGSIALGVALGAGIGTALGAALAVALAAFYEDGPVKPSSS